MRYLTLLSLVSVFAGSIMPGVLLPCRVLGYLFYSTSVLALVPSTAFSALRIWAIWGCHWLPLAIILPISLAFIATQIYQNSAVRVSVLDLPFPVGGCLGAISLSPQTAMRVATVSRTCAIAADLVVVVATWVKTYSIRRGLTSRAVDMGQPVVSLSGLLIRDGTLYFIVLLCLSIAALVLITTPSVIFNPTSPFIDSFTAVLLGRLILNLRSFDLPNGYDATANTPQVSSVRFADAVLDNIGASVATDVGRDFEDSETSGPGLVEATLDRIIQDPLAVAIEQEIRQKTSAGVMEETIINTETGEDFHTV